MQGKVALEEHFAIEATLADSKGFGAHVWEQLGPRLTDFQDQRLRLMDASGVALMILSLNAPAVQGIPDTARAIHVARAANERLAAEIAKRPDRFRGFAALPMQDPEAAARELTHCVRELGFVGALVNGFSQVERGSSAVYYDLPQYRPFWQTVAALGVPFYLHPRNPLPGSIPGYAGHDWLMGPTWAFHAETAVHALRLIGCGLFDAHPRLRIILGHLGEGIPAYLWRIDHRNEWMQARHAYAAKRPVADYFRENFVLTTSGNFSTSALTQAIAEIGIERVLWSADYPFEDISHAADWIDAAPLSEQDREKIVRTNALKLFKL
ncbi:MAG TPA: amidohydrolase family protein [Xanthobacteraceae bacterium]|nr:amidohydrolase family protein [Xanthobacteraceae bacterium]